MTKRLMLVFNNRKSFSWEYWNPNKGKNVPYIIISALTFIILTISLIQNPLAWHFTGNRVVPVSLYEKMAKVEGEHRVLMTYNISSTLIPYVPRAQIALDGRTDKYGSDGSLKAWNCMRRGVGCDEVLKKYPNSTDAFLRNKDKLVRILVKQGWVIKGESIIDSKNKYIWLSNKP